jgi:hypothetical protein
MLRFLDKASIDARGRGAADAATSGHGIQRSAAIGLRCGDANAVPCHGTMIYLSIPPFVIYDVDPAARQSRYPPQRQVTDLLPAPAAGPPLNTSTCWVPVQVRQLFFF